MKKSASQHSNNKYKRFEPTKKYKKESAVHHHPNVLTYAHIIIYIIFFISTHMIQLRTVTKSTSSSNRSKERKNEFRTKTKNQPKQPFHLTIFLFIVHLTNINVVAGVYCSSSDLLQFDRRLITFCSFPKSWRDTEYAYARVHIFSVVFLLLLCFDSPIFTIRADTENDSFFCGFFFIHLLLSFSILDL